MMSGYFNFCKTNLQTMYPQQKLETHTGKENTELQCQMKSLL